MIVVSDDFKLAMTQPVKELQAFVDSEGETIRDEDDLISYKISGDGGLCKTVMRKFELKHLGNHNLLGKWATAGFSVKLPSGVFEPLNYGSFMATEVTTAKDTDVTSVVGYDKMINAMRPYLSLNIEYPIDLFTYTQELCKACDLELGNTQFEVNGDLIVERELFENIDGITYRDIFTQIAQATASTCIVGNDDKIYFKPISKSVTVQTDYYEATLSYAEDDVDSVNPIFTKTDTVLALTPEQIANLPYFESGYQTTTGETVYTFNMGELFVCAVETTATPLTYDNMFKLNLEAIYGEINSVVLARTPQEDNVYLRDEESISVNGLTEFKIENNEFLDKDRENTIIPIYNALRGVSYYPFEATTEGLGWYEITDNFNIVNDTGDVYNTSLFNFSITMDGSLKETLKTTAETKTQTQYQYATSISKRVKNTEILVNKQDQYIQSLVTDMYEEDGVINEKFTKVYQDVNNIINAVQTKGGNNLIKDSVMFAYDNNVQESHWDVVGVGEFEKQSDTEALKHGGVSGHSFTLNDKFALQLVDVVADGTTTYTFSTKIKKNVTGSCRVRLYNSLEEHIIEIPEGTSAYYDDYEITVTPKEDYYDLEFYGSADSDATFTDNMFAVGEYKSQWTQANGEIMNTQVNINIDGICVKSSVYVGDYTVMSPLEFAGYSNINGTITRVFSLNKDVTEVERLRVNAEIAMAPIKIVPITEGDLQGWAFVPST